MLVNSVHIYSVNMERKGNVNKNVIVYKMFLFLLGNIELCEGCTHYDLKRQHKF
jgi:hypothetical protein